MDIYCR